MKAYVNMSDMAVKHREEKALDDLVWRVMENEKGRPFDLVDFLAEQKDLAEMVLGMYWGNVKNYGWIESRLRAKLEGSEAVERRAEEMSEE